MRVTMDGHNLQAGRSLTGADAADGGVMMAEIAGWPRPTLQHLYRLTDDCGVIQHAKFWFPDYSQGYCVDDNSRALIVAHHYFRLFGEAHAHELMVRYLAFIFYVQRPDGKVRNFIDYTRQYLEEEGSPDSHGRTLWGLGHVATLDEEYLAIPAREMFHRLYPHITAEDFAHAHAYGILGCCAYSEHLALREEGQRLVRPLADALLARYRANRRDDWTWFIDALTYANGRLCEALLRAGLLLDDHSCLDAGLESLDFINTILFTDGYLSPVGCHGWYEYGGDRAHFDQQPIDAGAMVEVNLAAHQVTGDSRYLMHAVRAMNWFYGTNILQVPVYNPHSGGCHDGLHTTGANENQGAESTLCYLMAQLRLYEVAPALFPREAPDLETTM
jgi:hypothetical protein